MKRGEVVALIGESGSGKTTIALAMMGHARGGCRIAGGRVRLGDSEVTALSDSGLADLRGRRVAYIAQSAAAAFNPSRTIMTQVVESALIHKTATRAEAEIKARALFKALALPDPDRVGDRYPHQVSGGQLQRLLAAMALITDPELVIFDEPTTALDVTTQIEVLKAFKAVVRDRGTTGLYVSHDLAVVAQVADRIVVLRDGAIREVGATGQIIDAPRDDYTRSLIAAAEPQPRGTAPLAELLGASAGGERSDGRLWWSGLCRPAAHSGSGRRRLPHPSGLDLGRHRRVGVRQEYAGPCDRRTDAAGPRLGEIGRKNSGPGHRVAQP